MPLLPERCNPYGFGTDAGPRHLMGGLFGPGWAGPDLLDRTGQNGIGLCRYRAAGYWVMQCPAGHTGPRMPLCDGSDSPAWFPGHVAVIQGRMAATCTACVMTPASRELWEAQRSTEEQLRRAIYAGDDREQARLKLRIEDIGKEQVLLTRRGLTPRRPLQLIEVS